MPFATREATVALTYVVFGSSVSVTTTVFATVSVELLVTTIVYEN